MKVIVIDPKARTIEEQQIPDGEQAAHDKIRELCSAELIQTAGFTPAFDGVRNVMWVNEEGKLGGAVFCFIVDEWGGEPYAGVGVITGLVDGPEGMENGATTMPIDEIKRRVRFIGEVAF